MSITAAKLMVEVGADTSEAQKGLGTMDALTVALGTTLGNIATGGLQMASDAFMSFGRTIFDEAMGAQQVMAQTEAVIKSTGGAAGMTATEIADLAGSLAGMSTFADDTIQAGENMLLTFTNIGQDVFPDATQTLLDLATAMGSDPKNAAIQLGKALNDPAAGLTALTRVGVTFTAEQEAMVKQMQEAGDVAGAQRLILGELNREFGGSAAAQAGTFAGQMTILQNSLLNVAEGIGLAVLPALQDLMTQVITPMLPQIQALAAAFSAWLVGTLIPAMQTAVAWVVANWPMIQATMLAVWAAIQPTLTAAGEFIQTVLIPALTAAVAYVVANWPLIQATIAAVIAAVQPVLAVVVEYITGTLVPAFMSLIAWVIANWPMIQATITQVMTAIQAAIGLALTAIQQFWDANGAQIMAVVDTWVTYVSAIFAAFSAAFQGDWYAFGENLRVAWDAVWGLIQAGVTAAIDYFNTIDWAAVGTSILQGIANGITAGVAFVADAARAAAEAALEAAKGFLGIESPSKVFAGVGENMMAGMANGIADAQAEPARATAGASRAAVRTAAGITSGAAASQPPITVTINAQVTGGLDLEYLAGRVARAIQQAQGAY